MLCQNRDGVHTHESAVLHQCNTTLLALCNYFSMNGSAHPFKAILPQLHGDCGWPLGATVAKQENISKYIAAMTS